MKSYIFLDEKFIYFGNKVSFNINYFMTKMMHKITLLKNEER